MSIGSARSEAGTTDNTKRTVASQLGSLAWKVSWSGGALALVDQAVVSATNFFTNVTVGKSCTLDDLGVYTLAVSLLYFFRGLQEQLVASPYTVYCQRQSKDQLPGYTGSSLVHQVAATLVAFLMIGVLALALRLFPGNEKLVLALRVMLIAYPCFIFREFFRKLLFAHFQFKAALVMDLLVILVQVGLCVWLWYSQMLNSITVFVVIALASLIACGYWLSRPHRRIEIRREQIITDWRTHWNFSKWALLTFLLGCSTPFLMPWFIAWIKDRETSALFFACATLVGLANMVLNGINNLLGPTSARAYAASGTSALWRILGQANVAFVVLLVPFCLLVWACGHWLPMIILKEAAPDLRAPLVLLAVNLLFGGLGTVAGNGLWAIDRPRWNLLADTGLLLSTFGLAYCLIPRYEVTGAAVAVLTGSIVAAVLRWSTFIHQAGLPTRTSLVEPT